MNMHGVRFGWLLTIAALPAFAIAPTYRVTGTDAAAWGKIFASVGIVESGKGDPGVVVAGASEQIDALELSEKHLLIVEGNSAAAVKLGFVAKREQVDVRRVCDVHAPKLNIIWEQPVSVQAMEVPTGYQVFANEKWKGIPVIAGKRTAHGAILWIATPPGATGMERYPYLVQALVDLGLTLPARTTSLWAFFDSSYRIRADVDYLARRWREAGIGVLHVAAWHNMEPDAIQDGFLKRLIEACHRNAILVDAWLELPHVSEKFWADHPAWREKTGVGQDAQLDWRKLMNLQNPACHREVAKEIGTLLRRFDWDGVNVAELYFESLEGASNPARFTPMNDDVRQDFRQSAGFDPKLLFDPSSAHFMGKDPKGLREFLDFRAALASRMQADWLDVIDQTRASKPYLDVVLTHIDDQFEPGIRDALGADVARSLPLIEARHSTLLVEDPATLWDLGAERYSKLAKSYRELTPDHSQLAIDINVVERYQDVYPTKKQTGVELFELVHEAATSFHRVALYFESSIEKQDLELLPSAASAATVLETDVDETKINAPETTRVAWQGPVEIDGELWPVQNAQYVFVPAGKHVLRAGTAASTLTLTDFNGEVRSALESPEGVDVAYSSRSRAIALFGSPVSKVEVDGAPFWKRAAGESTQSMLLPAGQHVVTFNR